jgi:class 3 adenylate cyclase
VDRARRSDVGHEESARWTSPLRAPQAVTPLYVLAGVGLPDALRAVLISVGAVVFLAGAVRYHVLQGQRGQFLARFLSPELARLVREKGLASTLRLSRVELSVVACDLRGFTTFAESASPDRVLELLREYYDTVGEVISSHGGSIKDFAGDGVLALVGAPLPRVDHAVRAVEIALVLRERTTALLASREPSLGVGIGVASGLVTAGAIGGNTRLEYAAVGPTVNLASRLCMRAGPGQVLIAERTAELLGEGWTSRLGPGETMSLKGFSRPARAFPLSVSG